jgi:protein CpxP
MKKKTIGGILAAGLFGLILLTGGRIAAQPGHGYAHGFGGPRMFERLGLNDAQRASIKELFAANQEAAQKLRDQIREQHSQLREAARKQPFDESQVRFQAQELAKLQAEMLVAHASLMSQVDAILTPEQRDSLNKLHEQRQEKFKERHQHQRRGDTEPRQG